jgi:hypothetical protein
MIIEDKRRPKSLVLDATSKGIPLKHPLVLKDKKDYPSLQDNFSEEYYLPLTRTQLQEANGTLRNNQRIKADNIKKTSGYESDIYNLRMGKWH